ncbi:type I polyketide synthase [Kitasatospora sp. NBC_00374]|uniref:type I polyketide synthase n=1 Tax=Kitasatospora sp. NBC_00374 TaxID=2975964 RepID=UPI0032521579
MGVVRDKLLELAGGDREAYLAELVAGEVNAVLGRDRHRRIPGTEPWRRLGVYRHLAEDLRLRLGRLTALPLPATLLFDCPTPQDVVHRLRDQLLGERAEIAPVAAEGDGPQDDPVVIVGMACRYPGGVGSPEDLWRLLTEGRDAVGGFPRNRGWDLDGLYHPDPAHHGTTYAREGGFVHDADEFDAGFFGIGPREATAMDPQQRMLLEASWEAVERAGIDPLALKGSRSGVFVGIAYQDYGPSWYEAPEEYEGHLLMGSLTSAASGRISYTLGLEGPALTVDTACSSSLVALHLAAQSLRAGECSLALAGGAQVMATPGVFLEFSRKRGLSPSGRCRSFSDAADGTGWAEGVGVVVLERLSDARRHGHRVLALVRGTSVNQDGASNGLTAPNGPAQQRMIRQTLANARLAPHEVDAVEAHGTGTALGDPIEAQALIATYGQGRAAGLPLLLGSMKSNLGHSKAAAGIGGVIKMVLAMQHGLLPRTLHAEETSRRVDWTAGAVEVLTRAREWPRTGRPRRAAVSAFGVSGTNAHVILEQAPQPVQLPAQTVRRPAPAGAPLPWVLSGRDEAALRGQAARLHAYLVEHPDTGPADTGYTLARRSRFDHRAVLVGTGREDLLDRLAALAEGRARPGLFTGVATGAGRLAFLFTGQGSHRVAMGRELYAAHRPFAAAFDAVCDALDRAAGPRFDRPVREVLRAVPGTAEAALPARTDWAQAALFALEVALFRQLEAWGVVPDLLLGHSVGGLAAAHVAGVWTLEDACTVVAARGRLMRECRADGVMVAVRAAEAEVRESLAGLEHLVAVAAVNGPRATVLSGDREATLAVARRWAERGRRTKSLNVGHAFHSPHLDGMLDAFRQVVAGVTAQPARIPLVSDLTGRPAGDHELADPGYWADQVRGTVRFLDGMRTLQQEGATHFLELGPDPVLTALGHECLDHAADPAPVLLAAQRGDRAESPALAEAVAQLHATGVAVDFADRFGRAAPADLPTYAFQRRRYWLDAPRLASGRAARGGSPGRYRVGWQRAEARPGAPGGRWLLVVPDGGARATADLLAGALASAGATPVLLPLGGSARDRERLAGRLARTQAGGPAFSGVLSLLALDGSPDAGQPVLSAGLAGAVALAQALADLGWRSPLWCVTSGAVSVGAGDPVTDPGQAMHWGLGRTVGLERAGQWGGLVDLPPSAGPREAEGLCAALAGVDGEDQIAVRADGRWVRRLLPAGPPRPPARPWQPRGTVLVTGGTGALGARAARWLAGHGAARLVLTSRQGPDAPGAARLTAELAALGAQVTVVACDVADRDALAALLAPLAGELTAVVHAAGVSGRFVPLTETEPAEFAEVVRAKAAGAVHLDALLAGHRLDAFVTFASIAGTWGSGGQGAYSAANAFLDALAEHRRARGLPATSVAWGPWAENGMAADPAVADQLRRRGLVPMAPEPAVEALWQAVAEGETTVTVAEVDWERFGATFTAARPSRLFDALPGRSAAGPASGPVPGPEAEPAPAPADGFAALSDAERPGALLDLVRSRAAALLGHGSPDEIDPARSLLDQGFDSLAAVRLCQELAAATGLRLPTPMVFEHPTARALAHHLAGELAAAAARTARPTDTASVPAQAGHDRPGSSWSGSIRRLYRKACADNRYLDGLELLSAAARIRPVFRSGEEPAHRPAPVRLAEGEPDLPGLVCLPPIIAPSGPHNYARLAAQLAGRRSVYAYTHPGFGDGQALPESWDLTVDLHARAVRRDFAGRPYALAGYSSGGCFAHAVTDRLEALGAPPAGVVLLDSLPLVEGAWARIRPLFRTMALDDQAFALMTDDQLTAMAHHLRLFEGWKPTPLRTPMLMVRATDPVPDWEDDWLTDRDWENVWHHGHRTVLVPGDHWSLMNENAESTAEALHRWLLEPARPTVRPYR